MRISRVDSSNVLSFRVSSSAYKEQSSFCGFSTTFFIILYASIMQSSITFFLFISLVAGDLKIDEPGDGKADSVKITSSSMFSSATFDISS